MLGSWTVRHLCLVFISVFSDRYQNAAFELERILQGAQARPPLREECKSSVATVFTPLIERVYIRKYFDPSSRVQLRSMFDNIREAFGEMLANNTWMDEQTKKEATNKVIHIK